MIVCENMAVFTDYKAGTGTILLSFPGLGIWVRVLKLGTKETFKKRMIEK